MKALAAPGAPGLGGRGAGGAKHQEAPAALLVMRAAAAAVLMLTLAGCMDSSTDGRDGAPDPVQAVLSLLPPVDLDCPPYLTYRSPCGAFGEPQVEVAGDGTIWYSAVCCIGQSPPIWRSFDGGETFEPLEFAQGTGVLRDAFGIEGDFAIDDAGNVYFFDISAATAYFTKYAADGEHIHTKPDVFPPLVDRPWVRAGAEDEVFIAYNTASSTWFYSSDDGGLTWDRLGGQEFPCPLMSLGQGPVRDHLIIAGCPQQPSAWISLDGGANWGEQIPLPLQGDDEGSEFYMQGAADAASITYVPVTHSASEDHSAISVFAIHPDGTVAGPHPVTPRTGLVDKPWLVAGLEGVVALAYYEAENVKRANEADEAVWHLKISYSLDADTTQPTWTTVRADPEPVLEGFFGRSLGDFLQLRQTPDGDLVVAYASRVDGELTNRFVRSAPGDIDFGPEVFRNGPQPAGP